MDEIKINFCPKCRKPAEAKEFLTGLGGMAYRIGATSNWFVCKCGYKGPSLVLPVEEYKKLISEFKKI